MTLIKATHNMWMSNICRPSQQGNKLTQQPRRVALLETQLDPTNRPFAAIHHEANFRVATRLWWTSEPKIP